MENLDKKYWVGICPPMATEDHVGIFKKELEERIGWYSSANSKAHISFMEFFDEDGQLHMMEEYLSRFCKNIEPFNAVFDHFGRFARAYCLLPDDASRKLLANLMRQFHRGKPFAKEDSFDKPHISIGRKLSEEQIAVANDLFSARLIRHGFQCNDLCIRKFNPVKKQYEVYKRFTLCKPPDLSLF